MSLSQHNNQRNIKKDSNMSLSESETIYLVNEQDLKEGYFQIGTSLPRVYNRVIKRLGKENLLSEEIRKDREGKVTWYQMRIPRRFLSRNLLIKKLKPLTVKRSES